MTADPAGAGVRAGERPAPAADEAAARRRHPSARPWRPDHDRLAARLTAHLEALGWSPTAAHAAATEARAAIRPG